MKSYCTQNNGDCSTCSLVNYGRDCRNNPIDKCDNCGRRDGELADTPWGKLCDHCQEASGRDDWAIPHGDADAGGSIWNKLDVAKPDEQLPPEEFITCPRCKQEKLRKKLTQNALSRRDNKTYICSDCGTVEAMIDAGLAPRDEVERQFLQKLIKSEQERISEKKKADPSIWNKHEIAKPDEQLPPKSPELHETLDSGYDITCPKCGETATEEQVDEFNFMDEEERNLTCVKCGHKFGVRIERPLVVEVYDSEFDE